MGMRAVFKVLMILTALSGPVYASQALFWDDSGAVYDEPSTIWDAFGAPSTPTPVASPTGTLNPTFTQTTALTATPTATETFTPFIPVPTATATFTAAGQLTFTPTPTLAINCGRDTHERIPRNDNNFLRDTQGFLCREDAERFVDNFQSYVVTGGDGAGSVGTTWTPGSPLYAYANGYWINGDTGTVSFAGQVSTSCWIVAAADTNGMYAGWTRSGSTHYLSKCGSSKPALPPNGTIWISEVRMNSDGVIDSVFDLRNFTPYTRSVYDAPEFTALPMPWRGQLGFEQDDQRLYLFRNPTGWTKVLDASNGLLLDQPQMIHDVKTFTDFPVKSGSLSPTDSSQFATKSYVDATGPQGANGLVDPPELLPLTAFSFPVSGVPGVTMTSVCFAGFDGLGSTDLFLLWAFPVAADTGGGGTVRVVVLNAGNTVNKGLTAVRVKCLG